MEKRMIYFDNNATTPLHPEVKKAITEVLDVFGNPSSLHGFGRHARTYVEEARQMVAGFIGAKPDEIMFVGSGSEGNNTVLSILTCQCRGCDFDECTGKELITTKIEHPCILETSRCLMEKGVKVTYLDVDSDGKVDLGQLEQSITPMTGLVSVMMANNEIGTIQDIGAISRICHEKGTLLHTDAVQAVGKVPVNVNDLGVDFLTLSGHKIYGPKGVGAVYVRKGSPFCPLIRGGHQERGRRAGTENTIGIVALGKAIEMRGHEMDEEEKRLKRMKEALRKGIAEKIPDIHFIGHPVDTLPGTLNVSFDGAEGEAILLYLDLAGIAVSTGSACASGSLDPSHVILATGLPAECAHGSIRISMGRENTFDDVDVMLTVLPDVIARIREMSSAYARRQ
ncbi:MAG TPA: cysteine desulfurase family protein [Deltaproteobacteria bacterium]|nr:cysteine desulfurase family protein [Deltaproteobacteria bacterium]HPR54914.1 cysteine desulfurase family protein [Deltaproteobacteria bacterium]HXK48794.1 cysteine desulfurase family protein [Deltaproteobacteria bacterium]